jgi:hypothetical protein
VFYTGAAGTGAAWLTGSSAGPQAYANMIEVPVSLTSQWMTSTSTLTNVSGDPVAVQQCLVSLHIIPITGIPSGPGSIECRLHGVYVAEFIGDD